MMPFQLGNVTHVAAKPIGLPPVGQYATGGLVEDVLFNGRWHRVHTLTASGAMSLVAEPPGQNIRVLMVCPGSLPPGNPDYYSNAYGSNGGNGGVVVEYDAPTDGRTGLWNALVLSYILLSMPSGDVVSLQSPVFIDGVTLNPQTGQSGYDLSAGLGGAGGGSSYGHLTDVAGVLSMLTSNNFIGEDAVGDDGGGGGLGTFVSGYGSLVKGRVGSGGGGAAGPSGTAGGPNGGPPLQEGGDAVNYGDGGGGPAAGPYEYDDGEGTEIYTTLPGGAAGSAAIVFRYPLL